MIGTEFNFLKGVKNPDTDEVFTTYVLDEIGGAEEEAISKPDIKNNGGKVLNTLLAMCVIQIGDLQKSSVPFLKWKQLIQNIDVAEQDMMVMNLRKISKGDSIELEHKCPFCGEKLHTEINVDEDIEVVPYNNVDTIEFDLPRGIVDSKGNVYNKGTMRRPIGIDREILDPIARKNAGKGNTVMLTRCILNVEGLGRPTDMMIRDLKNRDREYLLNLLKDNDYGMKSEIDVTCPLCGEDFTGSLNSMQNFL